MTDTTTYVPLMDEEAAELSKSLSEFRQSRGQRMFQCFLELATKPRHDWFGGKAPTKEELMWLQHEAALMSNCTNVHSIRIPTDVLRLTNTAAQPTDIKGPCMLTPNITPYHNLVLDWCQKNEFGIRYPVRAYDETWGTCGYENVDVCKTDVICGAAVTPIIYVPHSTRHVNGNFKFDN